jgi:transcriptional regulator with XRE-family HTH domain
MSTGNREEKSSIGQRLREERVRLSLSQADLGDIFDVDRKVVRYYEENKTSPRADQLELFRGHGADVIYILTGERLPLSVRQDVAAYLPRDRLALEISKMNLSEEDADILRCLAVRLAK